MHGACDELLPGATLAGDEHRAVGVRDLLHDVQHAAQRAALPDDALEAISRLQRVVEQAVFAAESAVFDGLFDQEMDQVEMGLVEGLFEIPVGPGPKRFDRLLRGAVAGDDDAGEVGLEFVDLADQLEPVDTRHPDIAEHEVEAFCADRRHRLGGAGGGRDLVAGSLQHALECAPVELFVVDN